jgi:hypothetical protein
MLDHVEETSRIERCMGQIGQIASKVEAQKTRAGSARFGDVDE